MPASVGMVYNEAEADQLLPDVYLDRVIQPVQPLWIALLAASVVLLCISMLVHSLSLS